MEASTNDIMDPISLSFTGTYKLSVPSGSPVKPFYSSSAHWALSNPVLKWLVLSSCWLLTLFEFYC